MSHVCQHSVIIIIIIIIFVYSLYLSILLYGDILLQVLYCFLHVSVHGKLPDLAFLCSASALRWRVRTDMYAFVFPISLLLYNTEAIGFSHTIVWSVPPDTEKISQQQLTLVIRLLHVEFCHLQRLIPTCFIISDC